MQRINTAVFGAGGRMGHRNLSAVLADPNLALTAAVDRRENPDLGKDVGPVLGRDACGIVFTADLAAALKNTTVLIDFSAPEATLAVLPAAIAAGTALVIGTTGISAEGASRIREASQKIPIVYSGNYSLGVNVLQGLIRQASKILEGFDIEVVEHHHHHKKDAPSGTAIMLAKAAAEARGLDYASSAVHGREGLVGPRTKNELGMLALRGGGIIGKHEVYLVSENETVELTHTAQNRDAFTSGVVVAVKWIAGKKPGL
ncbi:MAG: 4-hydroxy-tetrahydrodipicolinate reductase, partial [Spirochaetia bacterium]|nr:4-hydroxy-tetrahydrodipicolinate reductase [Spirochaetia bacterium]